METRTNTTYVLDDKDRLLLVEHSSGRLAIMNSGSDGFSVEMSCVQALTLTEGLIKTVADIQGKLGEGEGNGDS